MNKMIKKSFQYIFFTLVIIFTALQLLMYINNSISEKDSKTKDVIKIIDNDEEIKFTTINNELNTIENGIISDINKNSNVWNIKIILRGNYDEIINSLEKLNNMDKYQIKGYNIEGKKDVFVVKLELNRKK